MPGTLRNLLLCIPLCLTAGFGQNPRQPGQLAANTPLSNKDKFDYRILNTIALRGLVGAALGAGLEQAINSPSEWGGGAEGYAKRYGSTFGGAVIRQSLNFGFEAALNEDPRYFPLGGPSKKARFWSALRQTFITRTDAGNSTFAYGRVASAFATGQIIRTWLPPSQNSAVDGIRSGFLSLGVDAGVNLLYEFVPRTRPKQIGKP